MIISTIKQAKTEEKIRKRVSQKNRKASQNKAQQQKAHQRDKHLGSPPLQEIWNSLKIDKKGTQTNGLEDKKVDNDAQGLTSER